MGDLISKSTKIEVELIRDSDDELAINIQHDPYPLTTMLQEVSTLMVETIELIYKWLYFIMKVARREAQNARREE